MEPAGIAIFNARTALGMSRAELADRAKVNYNYLWRVESGTRTPSNHWVNAVTTVLFAAIADQEVA